MSTVSESVLSPTELQNLWSSMDNAPFKPTLAALMELLQWFKGDIRVFANFSATVGLTASQSTSQFIEPPDNNEEWEILAMQMLDQAHIDVNDSVQFLYRDEVAATDFSLQLSKLSTTDLAHGWSFATFPNRDVVSPIININPYGLTLIARRKDKTTPYLRVKMLYSASATVGTRAVGWAYIYRRRRLV